MLSGNGLTHRWTTRAGWALIVVFVVMIIALPHRSGRAALAADLQDAAQRGDVFALDQALARGARVNDTDEVGVTPLMESARAGRADAVRRLIRAGADVNHRARVLGTPLMLAVTYAHSDVARILLEHGADPGITTEFGNDALFFAAWSGDKQSLAIVKEYMDKRCRQASNLRQADR